MYIICILYVYYMYIICILYVYYMYIICILYCILYVYIYSYIYIYIIYWINWHLKQRSYMFCMVLRAHYHFPALFHLFALTKIGDGSAYHKLWSIHQEKKLKQQHLISTNQLVYYLNSKIELIERCLTVSKPKNTQLRVFSKPGVYWQPFVMIPWPSVLFGWPNWVQFPPPEYLQYPTATPTTCQRQLDKVDAIFTQLHTPKKHIVDLWRLLFLLFSLLEKIYQFWLGCTWKSVHVVVHILFSHWSFTNVCSFLLII